MIAVISSAIFINSFAAKVSEVDTSLAKSARAATLMDFDTGTIVFEKNSTDRYPIASMVKIMTLLLIFEQIENGDLSINHDIVVSENAASMGGSQAFLDANTAYKAGELIKSIIVASANDSCVALAEHICGTVDSFVEMMNKKASELSMQNTNFVNCTGLPAPNGYSCAKDVATMLRNLIKFDMFFYYAKVWLYDFQHPNGRTTTLTNTNKLIKAYKGCDGGKTGFTQEAQYCLAATAKRGDTRLISVAMGLKEPKVRNFEVSNLFNYGFGNYETRQFVCKDIPLQEMQVKRGKTELLQIAPLNDYFYFSAKTNKQKIESQVVLEDVTAPIEKRQVVGKLILKTGEQVLIEIPLIALIDIDEKSYIDFLNSVVKEW